MLTNRLARAASSATTRRKNGDALFGGHECFKTAKAFVVVDFPSSSSSSIKSYLQVINKDHGKRFFSVGSAILESDDYDIDHENVADVVVVGDDKYVVLQQPPPQERPLSSLLGGEQQQHHQREDYTINGNRSRRRRRKSFSRPKSPPAPAAFHMSPKLSFNNNIRQRKFVEHFNTDDNNNLVANKIDNYDCSNIDQMHWSPEENEQYLKTLLQTRQQQSLSLLHRNDCGKQERLLLKELHLAYHWTIKSILRTNCTKHVLNRAEMWLNDFERNVIIPFSNSIEKQRPKASSATKRIKDHLHRDGFGKKHGDFLLLLRHENEIKDKVTTTSITSFLDTYKLLLRAYSQSTVTTTSTHSMDALLRRITNIYQKQQPEQTYVTDQRIKLDDDCYIYAMECHGATQSLQGAKRAEEWFHTALANNVAIAADHDDTDPDVSESSSFVWNDHHSTTPSSSFCNVRLLKGVLKAWSLSGHPSAGPNAERLLRQHSSAIPGAATTPCIQSYHYVISAYTNAQKRNRYSQQQQQYQSRQHRKKQNNHHAMQRMVAMPVGEMALSAERLLLEMMVLYFPEVTQASTRRVVIINDDNDIDSDDNDHSDDCSPTATQQKLNTTSNIFATVISGLANANMMERADSLLRRMERMCDLATHGDFDTNNGGVGNGRDTFKPSIYPYNSLLKCCLYNMSAGSKYINKKNRCNTNAGGANYEAFKRANRIHDRMIRRNVKGTIQTRLIMMEILTRHHGDPWRVMQILENHYGTHIWNRAQYSESSDISENEGTINHDKVMSTQPAAAAMLHRSCMKGTVEPVTNDKILAAKAALSFPTMEEYNAVLYAWKWSGHDDATVHMEQLLLLSGPQTPSFIDKSEDTLPQNHLLDYEYYKRDCL